MGDLAEWVDEDDFNKGLKYAGRVAEEFKLRSGTWVAASALRSRLIDTAAPLIHEAVICGLNREFVSALVWLNESACRELDSGFKTDQPWRSDTIVDVLKSTINKQNLQYPGSSTRIKRIKLMREPLSPESGELSDKGSVNARQVLDTRAADIDSLYATRASGILSIE
jgi:feruloyl-CoA synthase